MNYNQQFWDLVSDHEIPILTISQVCNAPLKTLLRWFDSEVPEEAYEALLAFVEGVDRT